MSKAGSKSPGSTLVKDTMYLTRLQEACTSENLQHHDSRFYIQCINVSLKGIT